MQKNPYESLLNPDHSPVAEAKTPYLSITERHLQAIWFEQKYFKNLTAADGREITVLSPGMWNAEAGPDFRKAHLRIGGCEVKGDIELHLSEEGWQLHKHHEDKRYEDVVLHLSLWKPKTARDLRTLGDRKIEQASLEPFLTIPISRIVKLIDLDLYPYHTYTGTGKCSQLLFKQLPEKEIHYFFQTAAEWRLKQKSEKLDSRCLEGISMALGYKHNAMAFQELSRLLKSAGAASQQELFAYALNLCGFFSETFKVKWEGIAHYEELKNLAEKTPCAVSIQLVHHQIRPFNHPIRRISYLTELILDPSTIDLSERLIKFWSGHWNSYSKDKKGSKKLLEAFESFVPIYNDHYFNRHYLFSSKPSAEHLPLIGKSLIHTIVVNVFFPILYESIILKDDPVEFAFFLSCFNQLPKEETGKLKYLKKRFFGNSPKKDMVKSALIEQGAYQLHRDFCLHYEASCEGCPFVNRYKMYYSPCQNK